MKKGFTLAEVLITLVIVGVVAALVLHSFLQKYYEYITYNQLRQAYSTFSQAYVYAVRDNGPQKTWDIGTVDSPEAGEKLYNIFKPYLLLSEDCGRKRGCFASDYVALFGTKFYAQPSTNNTFIRGILSNGVSFYVWSSGKPGGHGALYVDINGYKKPNKVGVDFFGFTINDKGIIPYSAEVASDKTIRCKYKSSANTNGMGCTGYFLERGKMDYLRRDISDYWK